MAILTPPELLEREAELASIDTGLRQAQDGEGRLLMIEGPAGIGKTRLLRSARERATAADMPVLSARGSELERDFPFAVVRQLLEPAVTGVAEDRRAELFAGTAEAAEAVLGIGGESVAPDRSTDLSFGLLNGLYWLLANIAQSAPTLIVVDDAHWSDPGSLRFLTFLLPRLEDLPILMVLATRPGHHDPALARLAADHLAALLHPQALSGAAVAELVRDGLASTASDEYCAACLEVTGGNPFLLRELLAQLSIEGSFGDVAHVRQVVPATI